jgi:hypothetical protein
MTFCKPPFFLVVVAIGVVFLAYYLDVVVNWFSDVQKKLRTPRRHDFRRSSRLAMRTAVGPAGEIGTASPGPPMVALNARSRVRSTVAARRASTDPARREDRLID